MVHFYISQDILPCIQSPNHRGSGMAAIPKRRETLMVAPMVSEVGVFQVTEVPTNWYEYTIPFFDRSLFVS